MKTNRQSGPASWFTSLRGWQTLVTRRAGTALGTKAVKPKGYEPPYTLQESSQCCRTFVFGRCRGAVDPRGNTVRSTANQGPRAVAGPNPPGTPDEAAPVRTVALARKLPRPRADCASPRIRTAGYANSSMRNRWAKRSATTARVAPAPTCRPVAAQSRSSASCHHHG